MSDLYNNEDQKEQNPYDQDPFNRDPYNGDPYNGNPYDNNPYNRDPYGGNPYAQPPNMQQAVRPDKSDSTGFGIASLVLGLISLLFFISILNIFPAILGIIFGIIQVAGYRKKGLGIAGITTSVLSIVCTVVMWIILINMVISDPDYKNIYKEINGDGFEFRYEINSEDGLTINEFPVDEYPFDELPDPETDLPQTDL
ncbi:MAG: hypothetical protein K6A69_00935 [Lachnospiraceae bacterium]|nr:hypothetical protein [Lachnospiraceae bacterium]